MSALLWVTVAVLANYRIARMLASEDGPFDLFSRLNAWVGGGKNWVGRGLSCPLCVGFWLALPIALLVLPLLPIAIDWRSVLLLWLGIAGAQTVVQKVVG